MTQIKDIQAFTTYRLIKSEDLNHHGTLFAGRSAEWFVESGFIATSSIINPKNVICLKIHGMHFSKSVKLGKTVCYTSKIVYCGRTSIVAYICVCTIDKPNEIIVDGFITFVHVNEDTKPIAHGIEMLATLPEDIKLQQKAISLKNK
ncbi:MAG: acyl-CoA thioesterase [Bacteroidales bacterium]